METHCCLAHEVPGLGPASVLLVLVWIALHDMHNPATVLAAARQLLAPGGAVLVLEFSSPDNFAEVASSEAAEVAAVRAQARLCLSVSVLHCLPVSKELQPSQVITLSITRQLQRCVTVQAVGTALSPATLVRVAARAGFSSVTSFPATQGMTMFVLRADQPQPAQPARPAAGDE